MVEIVPQHVQNDLSSIDVVSPSSFKVIGTDTDRSAAYDLLLTFRNNHGRISYHFRDKWRFQLKIANFPDVYFAPPRKGFPMEFGIGALGQKN